MDDMQLSNMSRRRMLALGAVALAVLALAGRLLLGGGVAAPARPPVAAPAPVAVAVPGLVVDVVGAIRRPGLLRLPPGSRIADAVARAGGATALADLAQVNLAAPLADGEQVVVPARSLAGDPAGVPAGGTPPSSGPVHLSTATVEQLDSLPGIGPLTAQKILDYRSKHGAFRSLDELDAIPGIGPARIDQLHGLLVP